MQRAERIKPRDRTESRSILLCPRRKADPSGAKPDLKKSYLIEGGGVE
jgi:hypothetical protein